MGWLGWVGVIIVLLLIAAAFLWVLYMLDRYQCETAVGVKPGIYGFTEEQLHEVRASIKQKQQYRDQCFAWLEEREKQLAEAVLAGAAKTELKRLDNIRQNEQRKYDLAAFLLYNAQEQAHQHAPEQFAVPSGPMPTMGAQFQLQSSMLSFG
jgi:hypothetical protein